MKVKSSTLLLLFFAVTLSLSAKDKNKDPQRGMLEKMEAVPCGANQKGITGLGTLWASAGITHVNSNEKLCPQYLLRTNEMDYQIRPVDLKHATILPVGKEGQFTMKKNEMMLTVLEGSDRKTRAYQVVGMTPAKADTDQ